MTRGSLPGLTATPIIGRGQPVCGDWIVRVNILDRFEQSFERLMEGSVGRLFRSPVQPAEIEVLQDLQHFDQGRAASGRRIRAHDVTAVAAFQRRVQLRLVFGEVAARDIGAVRFQVGRDLVGQAALVELPPAAARDPLQRAGVVGQPHHFAHLVEAAFRMQIDACTFGGLADARHAIRDAWLTIALPHARHVRRDDDAFLRLRDGRCDEVGLRHAAMLLVEQAEAQNRAVSHASRSTSLSEVRYRNDYVSQLDLLDAQRSELRNRRQQVQIRAAQYQATVALVRALGGGWAGV